MEPVVDRGNPASLRHVGDAEAGVSGFETFKKALVVRARDPRATIQKRGTITLNGAAYASLGSPDAVELLFDDTLQRIGIRACGTDVRHAVFVRAATKSPGGPFVLSAMAFLRFYAIDTTEAVRLPARIEDGVLCLDLDGESQVVSKRRTRRPRPGRGPD